MNATACAGGVLVLHREVVRSDWTDYNGHMSEAYYVLVFGHATDALYEHVGIGETYRRASGASVYTVEAHIAYLREANEGEQLCVTTRVIDVDTKRLHLHHMMAREGDGTLLAETELMLLHVDKATSRATSFPPPCAARLAEIATAHARVPPRPFIGRAVGMGPARGKV